LQDIPGGPGEVKPRFVSCEAVHLDWLGILAGKGYTKFKIINQVNNFRPLVVKEESSKFFCTILRKKKRWKTFLQQHFDFDFPIGSTGPFGNDSKGDWLTYDETAKLFSAFYNNSSGAPLNNTSWFDFHATY
ncbi:MAG TPA: hypothetical protein VM935_07635, partial [Chitinophagaceae bacterium]|nr:hypothetical protein [Chitinophagaceae bacterium]